MRWGASGKTWQRSPWAAPGEEAGLSPGHSAGLVRREGLGYPAEAGYFPPGGTAGSLGKKTSESFLESAFCRPLGAQSKWHVEGPEGVGGRRRGP